MSLSGSLKGHLRKSNCMLNIWEKYSLLGKFHENKVISQNFSPLAPALIPRNYVVMLELMNDRALH